MIDPIKIKTPKGKIFIGPGYPTFIVAEISGNHHLDYHKAIQLIDAAIEAGVDAVKIQTYTADTITLDSDKEAFRIKVNEAWRGMTLHQLYRMAYTPWDWQPKLKKYAESKGVILFSTPFDETAVAFLEKMDVQLYKIASFETGHLPLLKKIGQTGKPVIMSRGGSTYKDISLAIKTLKKAGAPQIAVLHCVSSYPAVYNQMNLKTIPELAERFDIITGLSDHTIASTVPVAAVALGASIIEKHLIYSRSEGGPDAAFSMEPKEFKEMVQDIRNVEVALGTPNAGIQTGESDNIVFRRSIFVAEDIKAGEIFTIKNIRIVRPGHGLHPRYYEEILGKRAKSDLEKGTPLEKKFVDYHFRDPSNERGYSE